MGFKYGTQFIVWTLTQFTKCCMKDVGQCYYCSGLSQMIWYIFDILASCNQVCDYWEPDRMDWSVLIRVHRTLLTDSCTERILTDIITLTLLSPGVTWGVRRQCRVMLTPVTLIEININTELTRTLFFAEETAGSRAGRQRGPGGQFAMPLVSLGHKKYYIGLFFKVSKSPITEAANKWNSGPICDHIIRKSFFNNFQANWFKAKQFCRYHGLHLASINAEEEQNLLEEHINNIGKQRSQIHFMIKCLLFYFPGMGEEHFWTSGADQAEEGR